MPSASASASKSRISASSSNGGDQQDRVGADRARLEHLPGVDDEVLAQRRQRGRRACRREIRRRALEERRVGQHAQRRGAVALVAGRDLGRPEVFAQHALARARLLDLGDHRGVAGVDATPQARRRSRAPHRSPRPRARTRRGRAVAAPAATSSRLTATIRSRMSLIAPQPLRLSPGEGDELVELGARRAVGDRRRAPGSTPSASVGATFAA